MMECTDRHDRFLLRLLTRHALLYTEMVSAAALTRGDRARLLKFNEAEHPVALQVGGSDPGELTECARYAESYGYDEVNINVGCPSDRVQSGKFGACLMAEPEIVAECVYRMRHAVNIPITVKTRIGVDDLDSAAHLNRFVETVAAAGCGTFIIHARKAWLKGLSPKQNREIPPLNYARVYHLKQSFAGLDIVINGGVTSLEQAEQHLKQLDGVMMGRAAYSNPFLLAEVDRRFFASPAQPLLREQVLERYLEYCQREVRSGCRLHRLARHITGLYQGQPGARAWRRSLGEYTRQPDAGVEAIHQAARERLAVTEKKAPGSVQR